MVSPLGPLDVLSPLPEQPASIKVRRMIRFIGKR
jgi:hypothetical protein